jgi:hypothetical protein
MLEACGVYVNSSIVDERVIVKMSPLYVEGQLILRYEQTNPYTRSLLDA